MLGFSTFIATVCDVLLRIATDCPVIQRLRATVSLGIGTFSYVFTTCRYVFLRFSRFYQVITEALPGVLGIQGEGLFIFRDLGRRVIYFQGFGEIWGVLGSREQGAEEKHFGELGRKVIFLSGSREQRSPLGGPHYYVASE